ncbi:MAG: hypothetical protein H0X12_11120 [Nocardioides sp.]|nr:hypothetical protein [Nocardioides sp.]
MRYSVVGAATLGFDLARLPHGAAVAGVLRAALACGPAELDRLAAAHPGPRARRQRHSALDAAMVERDALADLLPDAARAFDEAARGQLHTLRRLENGMLGDAAGLDHLVRHEIFDWTWLRSGSMAVQDPVAADAADVLSDAAVAEYLREPAHPDLWVEMTGPLGAAGVLSVDGLDVVDAPGASSVLRAIASADDEMRTAWRRVVDEVRPHTAQWAPAMHRATWAVTMSERLRLALDVQLAGVVAFHRGGFTASDGAYGGWNALAGVLQAHLVDDLLPASEADVLLRPWRLVSG